MSREIVIAGVCLLLTIGLAWLVDHPSKVTGSIVLGIAFCVLVVAARLRGDGSSRATRMVRRPPKNNRK